MDNPKHQRLENSTAIFRAMLKTKKGVSKKKLLQLIKRFGELDHFALSRTFDWENYFILIPGKPDSCAVRFLHIGDNNGHDTYNFLLERFLGADWTRIVYRPTELSLRSALELSYTLNATHRHFRLTRHEQRYYRHAFIGQGRDRIPFAELCRTIHAVFAPKPRPPARVLAKA